MFLIAVQLEYYYWKLSSSLTLGYDQPDTVNFGLYTYSKNLLGPVYGKTIMISQITKFPPSNNRIADIQTNNEIYVLTNKLHYHSKPQNVFNFLN